MFTISKIHKTQKFLFKEPSSLTIEESARIYPSSPELRNLIQKNSEKTSEILETSTTLVQELDKFGIVGLKIFFLEYPNAWQDLKRKLHRHRSMKPGGIYQIEKRHEVEILSLFLRKWREKDTGENIFQLAREEILKNGKLIKEIWNEPSLLDTSYLDIIALPEEQRQASIRNIIEKWLSENYPLEWKMDAGDRFNTVYPYIIQYLGSIFSIPFSDDLRNANNVHELSSLLCEDIWPKAWKKRRWIEAKNAWMITKAFHAWWWIPEIIEQHDAVEWLMLEVINKLKNAGITYEPGWRRQEWSTSIFIGSGSVSFDDDWKKYYFTIEYRAKGIESTLTKLFADEDYTSFDAMRDILGIAVILPEQQADETDEERIQDKINIIKRFSRMMSDRGYIYKEKWLLQWADSKAVVKALKNGEKKPIWVSKGRDSYSSTELVNASLSGFTTLWHTGYAHAIWTEVQFFEKEKADWWKAEHPEYHPRRIIQSWSRGWGFTTPRQIIKSYKDNLHTASIVYMKEVFSRAINSWMIIPYQISSDKEILFTTKWTRKAFEERFPRQVAQEIKWTELSDLLSFMNTLIDEEYVLPDREILTTTIQNKWGKIEV
jgi:hypothetical protein